MENKEEVNVVYIQWTYKPKKASASKNEGKPKGKQGKLTQELVDMISLLAGYLKDAHEPDLLAFHYNEDPHKYDYCRAIADAEKLLKKFI